MPSWLNRTTGYYYPNVGNQNYIIDFYPWGHVVGTTIPPRIGDIFSRFIDPTTGSVTSNTYRINNTTNSVDYYWDLNRNLAVSNCSNYGNDILTAWYNGTDIIYKHSTPDVTAYKATGLTTNSQGTRLSVYPNPASDMLRIQGVSEEASYLITDIKGATVIKSDFRKGYNINVATLTDGAYLLRIIENGRSLQIFTFNKQ